MKTFIFKMNEYGNVCYVYVDSTKPPIDTLYLIETMGKVTEKKTETWTPQSHITKDMFSDYFDELDVIKDCYNEKYDDIVERINMEFLLKTPVMLSGFYLNYSDATISQTDNVFGKYRFGVAHSHYQAKGVAAFCELSQILPNYNQGWEPDWNERSAKWCIQTVKNEIKVRSSYYVRTFLAFETESKANLFLKEKKSLVADLSDAEII